MQCTQAERKAEEEVTAAKKKSEEEAVQAKDAAAEIQRLRYVCPL
jgi:hypothetical protein